MSKFFINHIALSVKDVDKSVSFYQKVFNFKEIENTASNSLTRWLSIGNGMQLHLIPRPNALIKTNKAVHFALTTSEFENFVLRLKKLNIEYSDWLGTALKDYIRKDGIQQVYFQDPDAYWIEVNNDI
ncbi:VOC family protein [Nonlabens sp. Asnod3-H03]|uniref:VOC domain-containing protein n=1 Tax=Nonlabens ulvanivorans TaxID=906888 RepID=A0A081DGG1_NONUL|nr:VOC family protein [Nonlabens ulvanivorans]GAK78007.1 hypothetical protein JCM19296_3616 [Nonlabens ulvanivorans]